MTTAAIIVNGSLQALGVVNELSPTDEYLEALAFDSLKRLLNRWLSQGIVQSFIIPTVPADDIGNTDDIEDALITSLAVSVQKITKRSASAALIKDQKVYYRQMKAVYGPTHEQSYPASLPLGQGNNFGPRSKRFFPEPT
jgi:hypothetical protein